MAGKKSSTDYMRDMRARLKAAGYVKRELWILPEHAAALRGIEKALRQPHGGQQVRTEDFMTEHKHWTIESLHSALQALDEVREGSIGLSLPQGAEPSLKLEMRDLDGLPIYIAVAGEQILVDTLLVAASQVKDHAAFNDAVLRTRDVFPLSSIGLHTLPSGESVYTMFGALSAASSLDNIVQEIHTLAENVINAADDFGVYFAH
ncbi:YjfI family protein [Pseudomonas entomophila]|uniref:YjfI family protein n=1 Tax=Pseudomonas entomophila TaxID=312306 RepID=UPI00200EEA4F|nr:YjfI family protein [Pseudomonas entomophila]